MPSNQMTSDHDARTIPALLFSSVVAYFSFVISCGVLCPLSHRVENHCQGEVLSLHPGRPGEGKQKPEHDGHPEDAPDVVDPPPRLFILGVEVASRDGHLVNKKTKKQKHTHTRQQQCSWVLRVTCELKLVVRADCRMVKHTKNDFFLFY